MANPVGRPPKLTEAERKEVYDAFREYIQFTPDPIVVGFCAWDATANKYDITRDNINDWPEFSTLIKKATQKSEAYLATGVFSKGINPTMAIFRLKQPVHGYRDQSQVETTGEVKHSYEELDDEQLERAIKARQDRVSETP